MEETLQDHFDELVLCARLGELDNVQEITRILQTTHPEFVQVTQILGAKNSQGNTALHMAAANGRQDVLRYLLDNLTLAQINQTNEQGNTALHWAAVAGKVDSVRLLLEKEADPLVKNNSGKTAITEAEQAGHDKVVSFLLDNVDDSKIKLNMDDDE
ncbi:ankyrin repeat-containing protein [Dispira simplex]|nr:ankyrin repeat-containing protein [Dispira simplex]